MYLTRLVLNPQSRRVQREIAERYELHRTIMAAFPDMLPTDERVLFRLETDARTGDALLLVQSQYAPDWSYLETPDYHRYLIALDEPNPWVKTFDPQFVEGQRLFFRLQANPTVKRRGKRYGLYREAEQIAWLERKGRSGGFRVVEGRASEEAILRGRLYRDDEKHRLQFLSVQFDGLLQVIDPDRLRDSVRNGMGSGKGLGFGLLSLAPG